MKSGVLIPEILPKAYSRAISTLGRIALFLLAAFLLASCQAADKRDVAPATAPGPDPRVVVDPVPASPRERLPIDPKTVPRVDDPIEIVLIMDNSGSMGWNDPHDWRLTAVNIITTYAHQGDRIGVVIFDGNAANLNRRAGLRPFETVAPATKRALRDQVSKLRPGGVTDHIVGLREAASLLRTGTAPPERKLVFLLSDGIMNPPPGRYPDQNYDSHVRPVLDEYVRNGWKVHGIAFTAEGDSPFMRNISLSTRGSYIAIDDARSLVDWFLGLYRSVSGEWIDLVHEDMVEIRVDPGYQMQELTFAMLNEDGRRSIKSVLAPDGEDYLKKAYGSQTVWQTPSAGQFEIRRLLDPAPGLWKMEATGSGQLSTWVAWRSGLAVPEGEVGLEGDKIKPKVSNVPENTEDVSALIVPPDGRGEIELPLDRGPDGTWTTETDGMSEGPLTIIFTIKVPGGRFQTEPITVDVKPSIVVIPSELDFEVSFNESTAVREFSLEIKSEKIRENVRLNIERPDNVSVTAPAAISSDRKVACRVEIRDIPFGISSPRLVTFSSPGLNPANLTINIRRFDTVADLKASEQWVGRPISLEAKVDPPADGLERVAVSVRRPDGVEETINLPQVSAGRYAGEYARTNLSGDYRFSLQESPRFRLGDSRSTISLDFPHSNLQVEPRLMRKTIDPGTTEVTGRFTLTLKSDVPIEAIPITFSVTDLKQGDRVIVPRDEVKYLGETTVSTFTPGTANVEVKQIPDDFRGLMEAEIEFRGPNVEPARSRLEIVRESAKASFEKLPSEVFRHQPLDLRVRLNPPVAGLTAIRVSIVDPDRSRREVSLPLVGEGLYGVRFEETAIVGEYRFEVVPSAAVEPVSPAPAVRVAPAPYRLELSPLGRMSEGESQELTATITVESLFRPKDYKLSFQAEEDYRDHLEFTPAAGTLRLVPDGNNRASGSLTVRVTARKTLPWLRRVKIAVLVDNPSRHEIGVSGKMPVWVRAVLAVVILIVLLAAAAAAYFTLVMGKIPDDLKLAVLDQSGERSSIYELRHLQKFWSPVLTVGNGSTVDVSTLESDALKIIAVRDGQPEVTSEIYPVEPEFGEKIEIDKRGTVATGEVFRVGGIAFRFEI